MSDDRIKRAGQPLTASIKKPGIKLTDITQTEGEGVAEKTTSRGQSSVGGPNGTIRDAAKE